MVDKFSRKSFFFVNFAILKVEFLEQPINFRLCRKQKKSCLHWLTLQDRILLEVIWSKWVLEKRPLPSPSENLILRFLNFSISLSNLHQTIIIYCRFWWFSLDSLALICRKPVIKICYLKWPKYLKWQLTVPLHKLWSSLKIISWKLFLFPPYFHVVAEIELG